MEHHVLTSSLPTTAVAVLLLASGILSANTLSGCVGSSGLWNMDADQRHTDPAGKFKSRHRVARHRRVLA